ncbi:hypothetical protein [Amorphus sp. 3PC139-8]|uniref:hypothetical protein n=1 Tax=Amorphus sp. 3PC139-8 TaxID=2735676 RepID=UPI00345D987D
MAATLLGLLLALVIGATSALVFATGDMNEKGRLVRESDTVAKSIGRSIAEVVARAVKLGIPLADLNGVDGYFSDVMAANAEIDGLAIADMSGTFLFEKGRSDDTDFRDAVLVVIPVDQKDVGRVLVVPSYQLAHDIHRRAIMIAIAVTLLSGLIAGVWVRLYRIELIDLPRARLVASCRAVGRGGFDDYSPVPEESPLRPLGRAAARLIAPVRRHAREARALAEEIRAIDVTGSFASRVQEAMAPLAPFRFDRLEQPTRRIGWSGWLALPILAVGGATLPLIAGFAADRIGNDPLASAAMGGGIAASALGALIGLALARLIAVRVPRLAAVAGLLLAAGATGVTFTIHEIVPFALAQLGAGIGLWLAVWGVLVREGAMARRPWSGALILLCALGIGPILGGITAEIVGRRYAFLTCAIALAALALFALLQADRGSSRAGFGPRRTGNLADLAAPMGIAIALTAWFQIDLAGYQYRTDYATLAFHFAVAGTGMAIALLSSLRLSAAIGTALTGLAVLIGVTGVAPGWAISLAVGVGIGLVGARLASRVFSLSVVAAFAVGVVAAGIVEGLSYLVAYPALLVCGVAALVLTGVAGIGDLQSARDPARRRG